MKVQTKAVVFRFFRRRQHGRSRGFHGRGSCRGGGHDEKAYALAAPMSSDRMMIELRQTGAERLRRRFSFLRIRSGGRAARLPSGAKTETPFTQSNSPQYVNLVIYPQAYHITFGVYMSRPPGSSKPHVDRDHNTYGEPLAPADPELEAWAREHAKFEPVELTLEQRKLIEEAIRDLAQRYDWTIHAMAPQKDHVHAVISAARDGNQLRDAIKAVASRWLNQAYGKRPWWASGGSAKYLWERDYFLNAVEYVKDQRDF